MMMRKPENSTTASAIALALALIAALGIAGFGGSPALAGKKKKNQLARPVPVDSVPSAPMTISRANEEWTEALAQTRIPLPIKKGSDKQGWSKSDWLTAQGESHKMRIWVNDRDDLREIIPVDAVLVGANLICERWFVTDPKKGKGVTIDFRFANYQGLLRLEFTASVDELDEVERFLRFNVLTVSRKSDRLEGSSVAAQSVPSRDPAPATGLPVVQQSIQVEGAEVRPGVVQAGQEIELVISYNVMDRTRNQFPVIERRTLLRDGAEITFFEDSIERGDGRFTSTQKIRIPADARTGSYTLRARVTVGEISDESAATFEVR